MARALMPGQLVVTLVLALCPALLIAHESAGRLAQQDYRLQIDARNINLSIDTTFLARHDTLESFLEHIESDSSGGTIEEGQMKDLLSYEVTHRLELAVDGEEIPLYPLYRPQVEFREEKGPTVPARLTLTLFARTPEELREGALIQLRNRLDWQGVESSFHVEGRDGLRFEVERSSRALHSFAPGGPIEFEASCVARPDSAASVPDKAPAGNAWHALVELLFTPLFIVWIVLGVGLIALYGRVISSRRLGRKS